jgi:RNA polymerase sigma factor (sigma-70 family)
VNTRDTKTLVTTDEDLVSGLVRGDDRAFSALFDKYSTTVYRYAWGLADSRNEVPDIVQETFLLLWRRRKDVRMAEQSVLPWLLLCCRNTAYNLNRTRRRTDADQLADPSPGSSAWHRRADHDRAVEELAWILEEIAALPEVDRKLCELCLIEGRSYDEAAASLGISQPAARKRIERARRKLHASTATDLTA